MSNYLAVNYDETSAFAKQFHDEGDDIVQLYSDTRQRVQALHSDWVGEAAESFYEEMEAELLPALQRVSGALFLCNEVLTKMMKIIHEADEETAVIFKGDIYGDFGAGQFKKALDGVGQPDKPPVTSPPDNPPPPAPPPPAPEPEKEQTPSEAAQTAASAAAGGGGGGGGMSGQGIQGDLKGMGTGVGPVPQQMGTAGSTSQQMPDHVFGSDNAASNAPATSPEPSGASGSPSEPDASSGGLGAAAGAAGIAGAAAAAAKVVKGDQNQSG